MKDVTEQEFCHHFSKIWLVYSCPVSIINVGVTDQASLSIMERTRLKFVTLIKPCLPPVSRIIPFASIVVLSVTVKIPGSTVKIMSVTVSVQFTTVTMMFTLGWKTELTAPTAHLSLGFCDRREWT